MYRASKYSQFLSSATPLKAYPFGSALPGRTWSDAGRIYRYGFNSKEKDAETATDNYDFGARIYDGRLGRWLSLDPESGEYPSISSYVSMGNSPILIVDKDGKKILIYYTLTDDHGNPIKDDRTGQNIKIYYEYGSILPVPDNKFVQQTVEALSYISQSRAGRREVRRAMRNSREIKIIETDKNGLNNPKNLGTHSQWYDFTWEDPDNPANINQIINYDQQGNFIYRNEIFWNPNIKVEVLIINKQGNSDYGTGTFISAAVGLAHELRHINKANKNPRRSIKLLEKETHDDYHNKEEKRVVRWERRLVKQLNKLHNNFESKRYNHRGKDRPNNESVIDTSPEEPRFYLKKIF